MHIDSYQFGRIVINQTSYDHDVIVFGDSVQSNWWREQGHALSVDDLKTVIEAAPSVLVVGCGASGMMRIPEKTRRFIEQQGIELQAFDTGEAVKRFNELSQAGKNVVAALHLTC